MQVAWMLGVVVIIGLSACDARSPSPAVRSPAVTATPSEAGISTPPVERMDHSKVGPATPPAVRDSAESAGRATLSKEKEENAMPLPGQANDHSSKNLEGRPQSRTQ